jgi:hypothetical protein
MAHSTEKARRVSRFAHIFAVALATLLLVAVAALLFLENSWVEIPPDREPAVAFTNGPIGTELAPLAVVQVLPDMFPEHFAPRRGAGDWIDQFGFLRSTSAAAWTEAGGKTAKLSASEHQLPVGFLVSNYRPQSGAPSPAAFVGFSCVMCHSTQIQIEGQGPKYVIGPGNTSLNLFAWLDAFQSAILEESPDKRVTAERIAAEYQKKFDRELPLQERLMISLWLRDFRRSLEDGLPRFDEPVGNGESFHAQHVPTGPGRTQPFRTFVRRVLNRPGSNMFVFTKISAVYNQQHKPWAQVDGSVGDLNVRSSLAALAAGATVYNMALPEVGHNIRAASEYTRELSGPTFQELFADRAPADDTLTAQGRDVYVQHCAKCHGQPSDGRWVDGDRQGELIPLTEIRTDPERVNFRYKVRLPEALFSHFAEYPLEHPFRFSRDVLRPGPKGNVEGYLAGPIDSVATRAPYLHNASVLTLSELINLEPRRTKFLRGSNYFDPEKVGLATVDSPDSRHYFLFDTSQPGNSNSGHDYPWPFDSPDRNVEQLKALLEYLKTI